ncbi:integrase [Thioclava sp. BHET1]|nr:integrase [Thioclava sp. BHET1]
MTRKVLPKYVYEDRGYLRFIRRSHSVSVMIKEDFGTPEFWERYNLLLKGRAPIPTKRSFEALILSYYQSDAFRKLKPRTQSDYRKYIEHIRKIWGSQDPQKLEAHHVFKLHQENRDHWRQANYLVQVLVVLFNHAPNIGFLKKEHANPAKGIPLFKQESDGWEPWPDDVRSEFERLATDRARLVYELCIGTGQRIGDVLRFRWDHIRDGEIAIIQGKTGKQLIIPMTNRLNAYLSRVKKSGLTLVTDARGAPAKYDSVAAEMRKVKRRMQHPDAGRYVTHGLRKNATIELYEAGCSDELVKSVTGHSGVEMLKKYGGRVRQIEFARQAQRARDTAEQNKNRT